MAIISLWAAYCLVAVSGLAVRPRSVAPPTMQLRAPPPLASATVPPPAAATSAAVGRSALVLGWFHASERELSYVRKLYARNGYTDIVVKPSVLGKIAKPRGWYRTMRRSLRDVRSEAAVSQAAAGALVGREEASASSRKLGEVGEVGRHFDVVHCLSGGFLSLYVLLRSGSRLSYDTLLLDSTPILPKPAAYTRFARAFLAAAGWAGRIPLLLVPKWLHTAFVRVRWSVGLRYIQARHRLLEKLGRPQDAWLEQWTGGPVSWALSGDWERVARHAIGTVFAGFAHADVAGAGGAAGAGGGARHAHNPRLVLLHNPSDPFLDVTDVDLTARLARDVGIPVVMASITSDHVQAIFATPRKIFELLDAPINPTAGARDASRIERLVLSGSV